MQAACQLRRAVTTVVTTQHRQMERSVAPGQRDVTLHSWQAVAAKGGMRSPPPHAEADHRHPAAVLEQARHGRELLRRHAAAGNLAKRRLHR